MADWQTDLASCFNNLERLFASHAMDDELAFALLTRARAEGVTWRQLRDAVRELLEADGCSIQHIELQMQQVERRFRPWLLE